MLHIKQDKQRTGDPYNETNCTDQNIPFIRQTMPNEKLGITFNQTHQLIVSVKIQLQSMRQHPLRAILYVDSLPDSGALL